MPIGIVNKNDYEQEVNNKNKPIPARSVIIDSVPKGRGDKPETPEEIRNVIAQEALLGASPKELSREFNISPSSISAYKNGATSTTTYNEGDKKLKNKNQIFRDRIVRKAGRLSLTALDSIAPEDFADATLSEKVNAAKQMSSIVKDMLPEKDNSRGNNAQFIFFAPAQKQEDYYDVITVNE
jgi:hypothetical protein